MLQKSRVVLAFAKVVISLELGTCGLFIARNLSIAISLSLALRAYSHCAQVPLSWGKTLQYTGTIVVLSFSSLPWFLITSC